MPEKAANKISEATLIGDVYKDFNPDNEDHLYFLLQDDIHSFTIGLSDILQCLKFAEDEGEIPEIPAFWWSQMILVYPKLMSPIDADNLDEEML